MNVRRWEFWAGVLLVVAALLAHAMLPRYEPAGERLRPVVRSRGPIVTTPTVLDRWTGRICEEAPCEDTS